MPSHTAFAFVTLLLGNTTRNDYTEEMEPYREIDPEGHITGWHYDEHGNQTGTTHPDGTLSMRVFDEKDRMILQMSPKGTRQIYVYDTEHPHRVRTVIEEDDTQTNFHYNSDDSLAMLEKGGRSIDLGQFKAYLVLSTTSINSISYNKEVEE